MLLSVRSKADLLRQRFGEHYYVLLAEYGRSYQPEKLYEQGKPATAEQIEIHFEAAVNAMYKHYFNDDDSWKTLVN